MDAVFLINKEVGWTSFDLCAKLRKKFDTKKVGHTGTLDPFAEGLMILTLGKNTKIIPFLEDLDKEYIAELKLGEETDTLDNTGNIIETLPVPSLTNNEVEDVLKSFLGKQKQLPPMYSALKRNGIPLYELARNGIEVEREEREIEILDIKLISFENNIIKFSSSVSKGTYIRSLAKDIALKLNTIGHLISLKRTRVGSFYLKDAKKVFDVEASDSVSLNVLLPHIEHVKVNDFGVTRVKNGMRLKFNTDSKLVLVKSYEDEVLAIYERREDGLYYTKRGLF